MATTLIARISKLEQYNKQEQKLYWQDSTASRWQNVYSKLDKGYPVIFLADGKVLIGKVESITLNESFILEQVKEFPVSNDDFLRLSEVSPENISTVKANFHPFITHDPIDIAKLEIALQQRNYISFYIAYESAQQKLLPLLTENDRVIVVRDNGKIAWIHQFKFRQLQNLENFKNDLFGSKDMQLDEIRELHSRSERKNNIAAVERMLTGLAETGFFKFKTFTEYYNIIHNKRLYQGINDEEESEENKTSENNSTMNLNTILYGPPGTGKTYHTINKSVAIANPQFTIASSTREELKAEYERLVKDGQIEFITFHQSMSYEDFIEGIKPVEPKVEDEFLKYEIKDGIFKRLCEKASKAPETKSTGFSLSEDEFQEANFYKMSLGDTSSPDDDQIYEWCINNGYIALGWGDAHDFTGLSETDIQQMVPGQLEKSSARALNYFIHYATVGNYVIVSYGNLQFRAVGKITGNYEFKNVEGLRVHQFRKVEWLWTGDELPYEEIYDQQFTQWSIYKLDKRGIKKEFLVKNELEQSLAYDQIYNLFLKKLTADLKNSSKEHPLFLDGRKSRIKVLQIQDEKVITIGESANTEETIYKDKLKQIYDRYNSPEDIKNINSELRDISTAISWTTNYYAVFKALKDFEISLKRISTVKKTSTHNKNYVLIIDEINRGNVSQIFGELITLIEEDKRSGKEEALTATLPYSKKAFSVPSNLYIIGTMNTADRSVEALDTALRRRFSFEPMLPDATKITESPAGINLPAMLNVMNARLEALLSKDHTIGHAWLMKIDTIEKLQSAFKNKILPLLQEFFYNDYAKIGLVLGKSFVESKPVGKKFAKFDDELAVDFADKIIYSLKNPFNLNEKDFTSIYE